MIEIIPLMLLIGASLIVLIVVLIFFMFK